MDILIKWSRLLKILIIHIRIRRRIDPNKIWHALVLGNRFSQEFFVFCSGHFLENFLVLEEFRLVDNKHVYLVKNFWIGLLWEILRIKISHCLLPFVLYLIERDNAAQSWIVSNGRIEKILKLLIKRLFLVLIGFHPVFNFIFAFLFSVKLFDTNQVKCVR